MTRLTKLAIAVAAVCAAIASPAAAKPTPTGSTAPAQVFFPNPVQTLRNEALTDQKDANYAALWAAYRHVALTDLDGSGTLTGTYAKVESETGTPARNTGGGFVYTRDQDQFEQTMGYYWVTQAQRYIQSLGFGSPCRPSTSASSCCASTSTAATTRSTATARRSSRSRWARAAPTTPRTPR